MTETFRVAKSIVSKLVRAGYIAYFAGGWVRDYVMGHPSEDIDIATSASPAQIMDLFPHTILVGIAFGVVIVVVEGHQFEVASFRKDLPYIDGRHPEGIEMSTPREDALRRDFTINGMFYDPLEDCIHDFVHGQIDIVHGLIRTIGDPHERFFEDRLRMIRAFRFAARFGFAIDLDTQEAIRENAERLFPSVAMERVWQEFNKMALYPRFGQALVDMHRLKLLDVIFPEIAGLHMQDIREKIKHFPLFSPNCPTILYLLELFVSLSFDKKNEIAKRLRVSNKDLKLLEYMELLDEAVKRELQRNEIDDQYAWTKLFVYPDWEICIKILACRYGGDQYEAFFQKYVDRFNKLKSHVLRMRMGKPLVPASLLQQQGIRPGKQMGVLLKEAEKIAVNENLEDSNAILKKLSQMPLWVQS